MTLRALFFDVGGVLVRTEYQAPREQLAERLNTTYEDLNQIVFESESSRRASLGEISADEHWAAVVSRLHRSPADAEWIRTEFFAGDVVDLDLLDGIRSWKRELRTGVISNAWRSMREYIVENRFDDAFDTLVISAEVGSMKPEAPIYRFALEQVKVEPEEALFVDDMPANVEAARRLGMRGIVFRDSPQVLHEIRHAMR